MEKGFICWDVESKNFMKPKILFAFHPDVGDKQEDILGETHSSPLLPYLNELSSVKH